MTLAPLLAAPPVTQFHVAAAVLGLASGVAVLVLTKGTPKHLAFGRLFAVAMLATAFSSLWITGLWPGRYSPIHILSIVTLTTIPIAVLARRRSTIPLVELALARLEIPYVVAGRALYDGRVTVPDAIRVLKGE